MGACLSRCGILCWQDLGSHICFGLQSSLVLEVLAASLLCLVYAVGVLQSAASTHLAAENSSSPLDLSILLCLYRNRKTLWLLVS